MRGVSRRFGFVAFIAFAFISTFPIKAGQEPTPPAPREPMVILNGLVLESSDLRSTVDDVRIVHGLDPRTIEQLVHDPEWRRFYLYFISSERVDFVQSPRLAELRLPLESEELRYLNLLSQHGRDHHVSAQCIEYFVEDAHWNTCHQVFIDLGLFEHVLAQKLSRLNKEFSRLRRIWKNRPVPSDVFARQYFCAWRLLLLVNRALLLYTPGGFDTFFISRYYSCPQPAILEALLDEVQGHQGALLALAEEMEHHPEFQLPPPPICIGACGIHPYDFHAFRPGAIEPFPAPYYNEIYQSVIGPAPGGRFQPRTRDGRPLQPQPGSNYPEETARPRAGQPPPQQPGANGNGNRRSPVPPTPGIYRYGGDIPDKAK